MHNLNTEREPLFRISKRENIAWWKSLLIRFGAGLFALLVCGIVCVTLANGSFFGFYGQLFVGVFGTGRRIWNFLQNSAILLLVALALAPAFKMKFWNIGAEGQVLAGGLACAACMFFLGGKISEPLLWLIMIVCSVAAGALWAVIPAIGKALWRTNETLFTLMMNYVAMCLTSYCINAWVPSGSATMGIIENGHLPVLFGEKFLLNILVVAAITVIMGIYLKFSKHGYELTVVGESENTARYIGISVKKVIIRTMILSGVICGLAGLLIVGGTSYTINDTIVGGRGFTAILVAWLAKFNPAFMAVIALLVVFLEQGAGQVSTSLSLGGAFPEIITGIFFVFIIACEFFINYNLKLRVRIKEEK